MSLWGGLDIVGVDVAPPPEVGSAGSMVLHLHHKCALDIDCKPLSQADSCSTASDQDPKCVGASDTCKATRVISLQTRFKQGLNRIPSWCICQTHCLLQYTVAAYHWLVRPALILSASGESTEAVEARKPVLMTGRSLPLPPWTPAPALPFLHAFFTGSACSNG